MGRRRTYLENGVEEKERYFILGGEVLVQIEVA